MKCKEKNVIWDLNNFQPNTKSMSHKRKKRKMGSIKIEIFCSASTVKTIKKTNYWQGESIKWLVLRIKTKKPQTLTTKERKQTELLNGGKAWTDTHQ